MASHIALLYRASVYLLSYYILFSYILFNSILFHSIHVLSYSYSLCVFIFIFIIHIHILYSHSIIYSIFYFIFYFRILTFYSHFTGKKPFWWNALFTEFLDVQLYTRKYISSTKIWNYIIHRNMFNYIKRISLVEVYTYY